MDKEFYDKYSEELGCKDCIYLDKCLTSKEPFYDRCRMYYYKEQVDRCQDITIPKFKIKQKVFGVHKYGECVVELKIVGIKIDSFSDEIVSQPHNKTLTYMVERQIDGDAYWLSEEEIYLTKEEAEKKLLEIIRGED